MWKRTQKMVVDSNYLQDDLLAEYLERRPENFAVLTDCVAMEAYKGNTLASIFRSMEILSNHPKQVIVLKGTQEACALRGRRAGLQRRLIDQKQTHAFDEFCRNLKKAEAGNRFYQKQVLERGITATKHMESILEDAKNLPNALLDLAKTFTEDELSILRTDKKLTDEIAEKFRKSTLSLALRLFEMHPKTSTLPNSKELLNTLIFRYALCCEILAFDWISAGSPMMIKPEKMRNDIIDANVAAFASFFDGLLTRDKKLQTIHSRACFLIDGLS